ncbi:MAG: VOC family protein [Dehalococcoidia bacterium]
MATSVKPIPDGYHTVTPYMYIRGAAQAIDFYKRALSAEELFRMPGPDGTLGHAEIKIGDSVVMLADENPSMGIQSPQSLNGTSFSYLLYVEDVDAAFQRAVDAGATVTRPLENRFYGDRTGVIVDPFGHEWSLATHIEDVSPEEMEKRMQEEMARRVATPS